MKRLFALAALFALTALSLVGCGGSTTKASPTSPQAGAVYTTGEDAPLSSVVTLKLTINSITLTGAKSSPVLVSAPITVDFARLVGLRTLLGFGAVPADTYSSATFVLASPVISSVTTVTPATFGRHIQCSDQHHSADHVSDGDVSHAHGGGSERFGGPAYGIRYSEVSGG
jgi:hypothetical protein